MKKTAILVLNRNGRHHLKECFDSLLDQKGADFDIYLVDNASTDGSVEYTRSSYPGIKIIAHKKGLGFAGGYNEAVSLVENEYVALVSNDTKADPNWLSSLVNVLDCDKSAAIAGGKILLYDNPGILHSAGQKITYAGMGYDIGFGTAVDPASEHCGPVGSLCGAAILARKSVFLRLQGFDPDYFLLCEDTDLCWRAWITGYRVFYEPRAVIYHKYGATIGKRETPERVYYVQRNALWSIIKNCQPARLILSLAVTSAYTFARIAVYAGQRRFSHIKALLRACRDVLISLPDVLEKRRGICQGRKLTDPKMKELGIYAGLIETAKEYLRVRNIIL